jgi:hypothetical protein
VARAPNALAPYQRCRTILESRENRRCTQRPLQTQTPGQDSVRASVTCQSALLRMQRITLEHAPICKNERNNKQSSRNERNIVCVLACACACACVNENDDGNLKKRKRSVREIVQYQPALLFFAYFQAPESCGMLTIHPPRPMIDELHSFPRNRIPVRFE